jgi:hypothetical protein
MGEMGWFKWCKLFMFVNTRRQWRRRKRVSSRQKPLWTLGDRATPRRRRRRRGGTTGGGALNKRLNKRSRRRRRAELACRDRPSRVHHMHTMVLNNTTCTRYANHTLLTLSAHSIARTAHHARTQAVTQSLTTRHKPAVFGRSFPSTLSSPLSPPHPLVSLYSTQTLPLTLNTHTNLDSRTTLNTTPSVIK